MSTNPKRRIRLPRKRDPEEESRPRTKRPKGRRKSITVKRMLKAIPGTCGIYRQIAKKLGVKYGRFHGEMRKHEDDPDWEEVWIAIELERERISDLAEATIIQMLSQRLDFAVAERSARWVLERKAPKRGYGDPKKVVAVEGGDKPIQVEQQNKVSIRDLNLPLDTRRQILAAIEAAEGEEGEGEAE